MRRPCGERAPRTALGRLHLLFFRSFRDPGNSQTCPLFVSFFSRSLTSKLKSRLEEAQGALMSAVIMGEAWEVFAVANGVDIAV